MCLPAFKSFLRHSPFFFKQSGGFFCINRRYRCQDTGINVCSPDLKPVLRHSTFCFYHFGSIFQSIGNIIAKIQAKTCVFSTSLEGFLGRSEISMPRYSQKRVFAGFKTGFTAFAVLVFLAHWRFFASIGGFVAKIPA